MTDNNTFSTRIYTDCTDLFLSLTCRFIPVFLRYPIILENAEMNKNPVEIVKLLRNNGFDATLKDDYLIHVSPGFYDLGYTKGDFTVAEKIAEKIVVLPNHPKVSPKKY